MGTWEGEEDGKREGEAEAARDGAVEGEEEEVSVGEMEGTAVGGELVGGEEGAEDGAAPQVSVDSSQLEDEQSEEVAHILL